MMKNASSKLWTTLAPNSDWNCSVLSALVFMKGPETEAQDQKKTLNLVDIHGWIWWDANSHYPSCSASEENSMIFKPVPVQRCSSSYSYGWWDKHLDSSSGSIILMATHAPWFPFYGHSRLSYINKQNHKEVVMSTTSNHGIFLCRLLPWFSLRSLVFYFHIHSFIFRFFSGCLPARTPGRLFYFVFHKYKYTNCHIKPGDEGVGLLESKV